MIIVKTPSRLLTFIVSTENSVNVTILYLEDYDVVYSSSSHKYVYSLKENRILRGVEKKVTNDDLLVEMSFYIENKSPKHSHCSDVIWLWSAI